MRFGFSFYESDSFIFGFLDLDILEGQRVINFQGYPKAKPRKLFLTFWKVKAIIN